MEATPGPIARKLIAQVRGIKAQKVVDLPAWSEAKKNAVRLAKENQPSLDTLTEAGPEFALYTYVNNWAISMVELLQDVHELRKYMQKLFEAQVQEPERPRHPTAAPIRARDRSLNPKSEGRHLIRRWSTS
jgi:hypothetical protein